MGTNYELIPNILVSLRDRDTPDKFLVEKKILGIFLLRIMITLVYKAETMKNKMPLYRSSGTNFSTRQKGMLSPFQGKAFKAVVLDDYAHSDDCDFRDVLIEIVNHLFPKVFKNNSASYRPDGSIGRKLLFTMEEWDSIFEESPPIFCYTWYIKFSPFVLYDGKEKFQK